MAVHAVTSIDLQNLEKVATGKVRELYKIDDATLLMAVTDRISAYDVVLDTGIPDKGAVLCQISAHWFDVLAKAVPDLKHHVVSLQPPSQGVSTIESAALKGRCLQIRKLKVFPIEAIVRGYLTGSAWKEYQTSGTVHGEKQPEGLRLSSPFPEPIFTPSTKAEQGASDENISRARAAEIIGQKYADRMEKLALQLYTVARDYAAERGIILADTTFELGLDEATDEVVLVDEVLTPDSSRFWPAPVKVGVDQPSFDKQFVRDYLTENGLKGKSGVELPSTVVDETRAKYKEVFEKLTGKTLEDALAAL